MRNLATLRGAVTQRIELAKAQRIRRERAQKELRGNPGWAAFREEMERAINGALNRLAYVEPDNLVEIVRLQTIVRTRREALAYVEEPVE